ncbi:flagellar motor protein MotB [Nevskia soli]|uniref:flagellar motor protein MotB n=1 Tax=Nevskia soli TaxID=418856 RepID=UPI001C5CB371|nr:flagellar motor protein MotB [Nevskia soli]
MATNPASAPLIIIVRKKKRHGGHHGGAWKVAYADFVTAMMSLFIVLWLLNSSQEVRKAIGGYFQDPTGKGRQIGSGMAGSGDALQVSKSDMGQIKEKLQQAVKQAVALEKSRDHVQMTVTGEGLRIEMLETSAGLFFQSGSGEPTETGRELLATLAAELGKLPNRLMIEGHTDSTPYKGVANYSNWELSADRANAARRLMEETGLRSDQVQQVRGYADQDLRTPKTPGDASNRRISIIVKYDMLPPDPDPPAAKTIQTEPNRKAGLPRPPSPTSQQPASPLAAPNARS